MAKDSNGKDKELKKRIEADHYMSCAVSECYASFRNIINDLVQGRHEKRWVPVNCDGLENFRWKSKRITLSCCLLSLAFDNSNFKHFVDVFLIINFFRVIDDIFKEIDGHIIDGNLISECKMSALPLLYDHFKKLIEYLVISHILSRPKCWHNYE